jgi:hypothetical protein
MGQCGHECAAERRLDLEQLAVVDQLGQHRAHRIGTAGVRRDEPEDVEPPGPGVPAGP